MKKYILLILLILSNWFVSGQGYQSCYFVHDTLRSKLNFCNSILAGKYFSIRNIHISADYELLDSLSLFVNDDKIADKILILSPVVSNNYDTVIRDCRLSKFNRRLFVLLLGTGKNEYNVNVINENLILNPQDARNNSDPYLGITKTQDGFTIDYFIESIVSCYHGFHFTVIKGSLYLISDEYYCYDISKTGVMDTKYYKLNVGKFNIYKYLTMPFPEKTSAKVKSKHR